MDETTYDAATALIVVDMQNDFADPAGTLSVAGGEAVVPIVNAEIAEAKAQGALVVYTADWHPEHTPHFVTEGGIWPVHCVADTWGAAFHPDLVLDGPVVHKGVDGEDGYSGFTTRHPSTEATRPTELAALLRDAGITTIVITGLATDYCVLATALDGLAEGFAVHVIGEAVRAVELEAGDGVRAMTRMTAAGARLRPGR
ncbi:MAG TPA: isochorismatase family protein [Actinomycetota bacterium]